MTRDEAIEVELKHLTNFGMDRVRKRELATANIDTLIELGLLKVDTPLPKLKIQSMGSQLLFSSYKGGQLHVTPIVNQVGDTISLQLHQVQSLIKFLNEWIAND